jgi:hypothetical protein
MSKKLVDHYESKESISSFFRTACMPEVQSSADYYVNGGWNALLYN